VIEVCLDGIVDMFSMLTAWRCSPIQRQTKSYESMLTMAHRIRNHSPLQVIPDGKKA
jgi:hypothetical protein